jgi:hypothetical protein
MPSRSEQIRANAQKADELVKQLAAEGSLMPESGSKNSVFTNELPDPNAPTTAMQSEPVSQETEPVVESVENNLSANETSPASETKDSDSASFEHRYKSAVKAMNEAQRKAAEREKEIARIEREKEELLLQLQRTPSNYPAQPLEDTSVTNLDQALSEWEMELPDTTRIVKTATEAVRKDLSRMFQEKLSTVEQQLEEQKREKELIKMQEIVRLRDERVKKVHPDYDEIRFSDDFKSWIYGDAPSIYKAVYEGTVSFDDKDASKVIEDFKLFRGPAGKSTSPKPKPGAAEVSVKTQSAVSPDMGLSNNEETVTAEDLANLPYVINRIKDPKERKALMDRADKYMSKQLSK